MTPVSFSLDPRLAGDTAWIRDWPLSTVLLMNDQRYPWIVLVPQRNGVVEAFDMNPKDQAQLWREVMHAGELLKSSTACRKINIGALGNVVTQLHVHVVARNPQDAAGLAPVWGIGTPERYAPAGLEAQVQRFREILHPPSD